MTPLLYGLLAEFDSPTELVAAIHQAREAGYRRMEAYTPFPVEEVVEALHQPPTKLPLLVFLGGLAGGVGGFAMQWYAAAVGYPVVVSGKPLFSWPMFIPITFELTILCAALTAVLGMLALNGLPMPYHPLFHVPRFAQATRDRFFLCLQSRDPLFDPERTKQLLAGLTAHPVMEVPR
jgi:Alternative complex III, ActD subunit